MTYKGSSDFFQPFFWAVPRRASAYGQSGELVVADGEKRNGSRGKKYLLAGLIRNCVSERIQLWRQLARLLPKEKVRLFGLCGPDHKLLRKANLTEQLSKYKFYFAAE